VAKDALKQVDGAATGAWIEPTLAGWGGKVKNQIPQIYEAYARIFHPASDEEGNPASWGEVAAALGTTAHREMQWHAIVGTYDYSNFEGSKWPGGDPSISELEDAPLTALCAILARHTTTPQECFFGISTIHGGVEESFPSEPLLRHPYRDYAVLAGPLSAAGQIEIERTQGTMSMVFVSEGTEGEALPDFDFEPDGRRQAPNLIWPQDRAWFVMTEYDFDSTLVGGSRELIDAILNSSELEAWEVDPDVSLQADADKLNPVPDPPPGFDEPQDPVVLQREFFAEILENLRGQVLEAEITAAGILRVEAGDPEVSQWRLVAENSTWSPADPRGLRSLTIEQIELDPDTARLRCRLSDDSLLEIRPLARDSDDDPPSWKIETPFGMTLKHGPGLLVDDEALRYPPDIPPDV
jgi:hypothetical protein